MVNPTKEKGRRAQRKLKEVDALYLATDGDREGEAIAWHLKEVLKPKVPVYRMTFPKSPGKPFSVPSANCVTSTCTWSTRRKPAASSTASTVANFPVLWRKVGRGLSASRVQSVNPLVVERERERMAFVAANYWDLTGRFLTAASEGFDAKLVAVTATASPPAGLRRQRHPQHLQGHPPE